MRIRARASARCFIYALVTIFVARRRCHREFRIVRMSSNERGGSCTMDHPFGEFLERVFHEIEKDYVKIIVKFDSLPSFG